MILMLRHQILVCLDVRRWRCGKNEPGGLICPPCPPTDATKENLNQPLVANVPQHVNAGAKRMQYT